MKTAMEFAFDLASEFDEELRVYRHTNERQTRSYESPTREFVIEDYREGYGSGNTAEEAAMAFIQSRLTQLDKRRTQIKTHLEKIEEERRKIREAYPQFANEDIEETPNE